MEVKQKMQLANYVNVVVRDIETKEIISEQFKKNIILHQGMRKWLNGYANFSLYDDYYGLSGLMGLSFGGYINVGTGTGTPSKSDTTLFTQILQKRVGSSYTVSNYDAVNKALSITQTITVLSSELNGLTITEIGLGGNSNLSTKVMLDNPIAKTDTIEVQINYTITLQLAAHSIQTLTMLGYPYVTNSSAKKNGLFYYMDYYNTSRGQTGAVIQIGTNGQITNVDDFISGSPFDALYNQTGTNFDYIDLKSGDAYWIPLSYTYNEAVGTGSIVYKFKMSTLSSPNKKIKEIAMLMGYFSNYGADSDPTYPIFRMTLPCAGVFNEYTFIDIEQLNEDANTITLKRNNNIWNEIISGSEIIKVDGNVVSKDIDYTIDYLTGVLTWINKPLSTSSITATWKVPYIPKDDLLEFTFEYTIEFQA